MKTYTLHDVVCDQKFEIKYEILSQSGKFSIDYDTDNTHGKHANFSLVGAYLKFWGWRHQNGDTIPVVHNQYGTYAHVDDADLLG